MAKNTHTLAVGQTSNASPVTFFSDGVTVSGATLFQGGLHILRSVFNSGPQS